MVHTMIAELRQPKGSPSGAPYPYRKQKETRVDFLLVIMASAIARGRMRSMTTVELSNVAATLQIIGWQRHAALVYHVLF